MWDAERRVPATAGSVRVRVIRWFRFWSLVI